MEREPFPKLDPATRWIAIITAVLVFLGMVYHASHGASVSFPASRPGGSRLISWQESPFGFAFYGFTTWLFACFFVYIFYTVGKFLIGELGLRGRRGRW